MSRRVVRRVDHVNFRVADPRPVFSLLTEDLGLPVVWPVTRFASFENGAVGLGNMTIEPTNYSPGSSGPDADGELFSVCLEPEPVEEAVAVLADRHIPHSPPVPYVGAWPEMASTELFHPRDPTRARSRLWTWIFVGGFFGDQAAAKRFSNPVYRFPGVASLIGRAAGSDRVGPRIADALAPRRPYAFFCQFDAFDVAASRRRSQDHLASRGGSRLGLQRVREVVVSCQDLDAESERWDRLLRPAPQPEPGRWQLSDGPAVRLVKGESNGIEALVCEVSSLDRAQDALAGRRLHGLQLRLVEA